MSQLLYNFQNHTSKITIQKHYKPAKYKQKIQVVIDA